MVFYVVIAWGQTEPLLYKFAHGLKIVGGAVGGLLIARQRQRDTGAVIKPRANFAEEVDPGSVGSDR